jgi:phage FluMu protein Com
MDVYQVKEHLLLYGDLSGSCGKCNHVDLKLDSIQCPSCKTTFEFVSFRNPKMHLPKIHKLLNDHPQMTIVDYDDYKTSLGAAKAHDFLK